MTSVDDEQAWITREEAEEDDAKILGTLKWFDEDKGYGFIMRDDDGADIFFMWKEKAAAGFKYDTFDNDIPMAFEMGEPTAKGQRAQAIWRVK